MARRIESWSVRDRTSTSEYKMTFARRPSDCTSNVRCLAKRRLQNSYRVRCETYKSCDDTSRCVCIQSSRSETPATLERSPACNVSLRLFFLTASFDVGWLSAPEIASNLASISTSGYIRLFPIISDYIRLCHKTVASIRQGPAEVNEVQAGPNLPRQTLRRGPGFIQIICPTDHRLWRGAASEMLRQCKVDNYRFARG